MPTDRERESVDAQPYMKKNSTVFGGDCAGGNCGPGEDTVGDCACGFGAGGDCESACAGDCGCDGGGTCASECAQCGCGTNEVVTSVKK